MPYGWQSSLTLELSRSVVDPIATALRAYAHLPVAYYLKEAIARDFSNFNGFSRREKRCETRSAM